MTPVDMSVDFLEAKKAETTEWLEEADKVVNQYEKVREVDAALHGREYKPKIVTNGDAKKLEKRISELESQLKAESDAHGAAVENIIELNKILAERKPVLALTPDMMPDHYESHSLRRVKSVSDQPFITLPNYVLDGYSVGEMFSIVRRGDTIYLLRDRVQDIKEGTPDDPAERQPAASEDEIDVPVTRKPKVEVDPSARPGEPGSEPARKPAPKPRPPQVTTKGTPEEVRDWVVSIGRPFDIPDFMKKFGVSSVTAGKKLAPWVERGVLKMEKVENPGTPKKNQYTYIAPPASSTPRNRPVHDNPRSGGGGRQAQIPGTGKPHGPASTPGKLKKQQAKAARVKHAPVKGVRV
jgi:uncharacterized coiled-coil protein SlyX